MVYQVSYVRAGKGVCEVACSTHGTRWSAAYGAKHHGLVSEALFCGLPFVRGGRRGSISTMISLYIVVTTATAVRQLGPKADYSWTPPGARARVIFSLGSRSAASPAEPTGRQCPPFIVCTCGQRSSIPTEGRSERGLRGPCHRRGCSVSGRGPRYNIQDTAKYLTSSE